MARKKVLYKKNAGRRVQKSTVHQAWLEKLPRLLFATGLLVRSSGRRGGRASIGDGSRGGDHVLVVLLNKSKIMQIR